MKKLLEINGLETASLRHVAALSGCLNSSLRQHKKTKVHFLVSLAYDSSP
jgi:hypothetical protein